VVVDGARAVAESNEQDNAMDVPLRLVCVVS
jgi:hypothetical protein